MSLRRGDEPDGTVTMLTVFNDVRLAMDAIRVVSIDYTLTDDDGTILDTSDGRDPLEYIHGTGHLVPGLEDALQGKTTGTQMNVTVQPNDGYGERDEGLVQSVDREAFKGAEELEVGMRFQADTNKGPHVFTVAAIEDDQVTIDGNHPLAGVVLNFDVTVRDVRDATTEELQHGHVHGEGAHGE